MNKITKLDQAGINFLTNEEGLRLNAYQDVKGIWTISIGCTYYPNGRPVQKGDKLTKEEAINLFKIVLKDFEACVTNNVTSQINQSQYNALVSIAFNIGTTGFKKSTLLKRVNANPSDVTITEAFKMWRNPGLLPRRIREAKLYFTK